MTFQLQSDKNPLLIPLHLLGVEFPLVFYST
jgi:hypothetical protein